MLTHFGLSQVRVVWCRTARPPLTPKGPATWRSPFKPTTGATAVRAPSPHSSSRPQRPFRRLCQAPCAHAPEGVGFMGRPQNAENGRAG